MRLTVLTFFIFFLTTLTVKSQSSPYWFHYAGSLGYDEGMAIATDNADNVINVGYFSGTINFDITSLSSSGVTDGYIVKTASDGTYAWAIKFGGNSDDRALGVFTDALNNIYVTGYFSGTATFGTFLLSSSGQQDVFILKIDPNGIVQWVSQCGGSGNDIGNAICLDPTGNIIVTGQFRETAQFGSNSLTSMIDPVSGFSSTDIFTTKLDASGNFQWAKKGSAKYTDRGIDVSCDPAGNIYVTGQFSDTIAFDVIHTNSLYNAIFLIKYNSSGNEQWFNKIGAGSITVVRSIKVDQNADFYVSGECTLGAIFFGTPNITISNPYPNRVFAAKYNSSGAVLWATAIGSSNSIFAGDMAIDDSSNIYITGTFQCKLSEFSTFYGDGIFNSVGYKDIFTTRISSSGVWQWARQCGGPANDASTGIDLIGNSPVITGSFNNRFIYTNSPLYIHYEDAGNIVVPASNVAFCLDPDQGDFSQYLSAGVSDIYFGKAYDLARTPYDYYDRTNSNCTKPFVGVCINNNGFNNSCSPDSLSTCASMNLFAGTNTSGTSITDTMSSPGPSYYYLWSTGESTPQITVTSSGFYWVRITSIDGCFTSSDSIYATIHALPTPPLISDNHFVNTNALVTTKIKVCAPDTIILTASNTGSSTVEWIVGSNNVNGNVYTYIASSDDSVVATVHVVDSNYCTNSNWITLVVDSALAPIAPSISLFQDTIHLCDGGSLQFQVHIQDSISDPNDQNYCGIPNANFTWTSVPYLNLINICNQGQVATALINQSGTYLITCTIIRASSCGGNDTIILTRPFTLQYFPPVILTPPGITLTGSDTICPGDSLQLTATGGNYYTWTGPSIPVNTTGNQLTIFTSGYYCVTIYDTSANGCISTAIACQNIYGTIPPQLTIVPGNGVICPGDSVQLISPSAGTWEWIGPQGSFSTNDTAYSAIPGFYYCNVTNTSGCTLSTTTIELIQYTTPIILVTPSNIICQGDSVQAQVIASPSANIFWYAPFSNSNPIQYIDSAGIYVCFTESCNIIREDTIIIFQSNLTANINPAGSISLCENDSISLTTNQGMALYEWFPGSLIADSIYVNQSGNYYVVITDQYGCRDTSDTVTVNTLTAPAQPEIIGCGPFCEGDSISLSTTVPSIATYNWTGPNNFSSSAILPTIPNSSLSNTGTYYLTLSNVLCTSLPDSTFIQVDSFPPVFVISGTQLLCEGDTLLLTTNPTFGPQGMWTIPGNQQIPGSTYFISSSTVSNTGQYIYFISNQQCIRTDSISVLINALPPVFNLTGTTPLCAGDPLSLNTNPNFGNQGTWTFPNSQTHTGSVYTNNTSSLSDSGTYYFIISNQQCSREDSIAILVNSYPQVFTIEGNLSVCNGEALTLNTSPDFGNQGTWYLPDNSTATGSTYFLQQADSGSAGNYFYTISNQQCSRIDSVQVIIVSCNNFFPNVFTPNDDGVNDIFNASNADMNVQSIKIFNRWGDLITEIKSGKGWDGTNKYGTKAPAGTYFFIANYLDGGNQELKTTTGFLELIR